MIVIGASVPPGSPGRSPWCLTHRRSAVVGGSGYRPDVARTLPLRADHPPDDATVVVRAGVLTAANARRSAERAFALYLVYGLSVEGAIGTTVADACSGDRISSYGHVRLSTFGRLREAGFALLATFAHPHFTLVLPDVSELTLARLNRCFDAPIPNPGQHFGR